VPWDRPTGVIGPREGAKARDQGIHDGTLGNWVNAWRRDHPDPDQQLTRVERARVNQLQEEKPSTPDGERVLEEGQLSDRLDVFDAGKCRGPTSTGGGTG
jgi:hypothetical protein